MPHFADIVQSNRDGSYYSGTSHDPVLRCQRHNEGWTRSTKGKGPWKLVYTKKFESKAEALAFERLIKKMKSRLFIEKLIRDAGCRPESV